MYLCVCNAVSDRTIRKAVRAGASSLADLMVTCDAGTCCGACHPELESMLDRLRAETTDAPRLQHS
jgi:bacterioferritin-associated ferredoxin